MEKQVYKFNDWDDKNFKKINEILKILFHNTRKIYEEKKYLYNYHLDWHRKYYGIIGGRQFKHFEQRTYGYYKMLYNVSDIVWCWLARSYDILHNQEEFESVEELNETITKENEWLFKSLLQCMNAYLFLDYKRLKDIVAEEKLFNQDKEDFYLPCLQHSSNLFPKDFNLDELDKVGNDGMTLEEKRISEQGEKVYYFSTPNEYYANLIECIKWHKELLNLKLDKTYETIDGRIALVFIK